MDGDDSDPDASQVAVEFRRRLGWVIQQVGEDNAVQASGRSAKTLKRYVDGQTEPPFLVIAALAAAASVSITWLATGEGPRDSASGRHQVTVGTQELGEAAVLQLADRTTIEDGGFVLLPRFEVEASAGPGIVAQDEELRDFVAFEKSYLRAAGIDPRYATVIKVRGRSMMPTLVDGEWVIVDAGKTQISTGDIYAVVFQGELRVKRLRKERDGAIVMMSDNQAEINPEVRVEGPDLEDLRVVGRVDRHIRSL